MNLEDPRPRQRVLFLSFMYPSSGGGGSQLRAASLVRMLARDADIYLVIAGYTEKVDGPRDSEVEGMCRMMVNFRVQPAAESGGIWPRSNKMVETVELPYVDCAPGEAAGRIVDFYEANNLDTLFVFRFDALHFVYDRLESFPVRYMDLDELPSRGQAQIGRLRSANEGTNSGQAQRVALATTHILEKRLIPRFSRVFVASAFEAEEVRRRTGYLRPLVLPNVYPVLNAPSEKRIATRSEILFVGSFFYYPNVDAVLYFCREIFPLIQERKGDAVLFRVIGMGGTADIECLRTQPGVVLSGYQEDLGPFYAQASVVVVPLRAGAGTRLKILEAFAHRRPVVSTSIGAEGLEITNGESICLADAPDIFARACIELMEDSALADKICDAAERVHREHYSQDALERCYAKITAEEAIASAAGTQRVTGI